MLALAIGTQLPDLIDKPLTYQFAVLPSGRSLGHSLFFAAVLNRNLLVNLTTRGTRANQGGLLGFGGDRNNSYEWMLEGSVGLFLNRQWLVGGEYRQKPDNLGFAVEDDWWDVFVAWVPDRRLAVTAALVNLGDVATLEDQQGFYLSLQGSF